MAGSDILISGIIESSLKIMPEVWENHDERSQYFLSFIKRSGAQTSKVFEAFRETQVILLTFFEVITFLYVI